MKFGVGDCEVLCGRKTSPDLTIKLGLRQVLPLSSRKSKWMSAGRKEIRYKTENKTENTALPLYGPMVQSLAKAWSNALHKS